MCELAGAQAGEEGSVCRGTSLQAGQEGTGLPGEALGCGTELAARETGSCIPPAEQELKILNGNEAKCSGKSLPTPARPCCGGIRGALICF